MVEQLPSPEGALLSASCDETRILGARCEQSGLKELSSSSLSGLIMSIGDIPSCRASTAETN